MKALLLTGALALTLGCRTIATRSLSSSPTPLVRVGTQAKTWEVRSAGERLGLVVLFQERGLVRDSVYLVRNPWNQDLGLIDGLGRAYRYLPHEEEPAWVGTGTIAVGAQRILGAGDDCELVELDPTLGPGSGSMEANAVRTTADTLESPFPAAPSTPPKPRAPDEGLPQSQ
ncbi:MAG: hypothetical protein EXS08_11185 [Planctomycetes bacterium]|nr:hypothetical protein [Planctomycetota bacterium]